jgi:crotonobetainyl-CoA:carnitine CoA-transferase CaiB-like acyl-CoA transferase
MPMRVNLGGAATGPMAGMRVLDLSTIVSGPVCSQILGDLGADVIKVESGAGDTARYLGGLRKADMTGFFAQFNRNKRSVLLDLKQDAPREAFLKLAATADVVIENFRPGVTDRLGVGYERLREDNPKLVYVAISGFGPDGPYAGQPAYDMVIQAMSGFAKMLGSAEEPKLIRNVVADKTSGLTAAWATLAALLAREKSGEGQRIDVPMLDAFASFVLPDEFGPRSFGEPPESTEVIEALYRAWPTADGRIAVVIIEDHQFQGLCRVIDRPDLVDDERYANIIGRIMNGAELLPALGEGLLKLPTAELVARAQRENVPLASVNDLDAFLADPQVVANQTVIAIPHEQAGEIEVLRSAPRFSRTPSDVRRAPPMLGEHTEEVLREAGLPDDAIAALLPGAGA